MQNRQRAPPGRRTAGHFWWRYLPAAVPTAVAPGPYGLPGATGRLPYGGIGAGCLWQQRLQSPFGKLQPRVPKAVVFRFRLQHRPSGGTGAGPGQRPPAARQPPTRAAAGARHSVAIGGVRVASDDLNNSVLVGARAPSSKDRNHPQAPRPAARHAGSHRSLRHRSHPQRQPQLRPSNGPLTAVSAGATRALARLELGHWPHSRSHRAAWPTPQRRGFTYSLVNSASKIRVA